MSDIRSFFPIDHRMKYKFENYISRSDECSVTTRKIYTGAAPYIKFTRGIITFVIIIIINTTTTILIIIFKRDLRFSARDR